MRVTDSPTVEINPYKLTPNGGIITVLPCLNFLTRVSPDGVPQPELAASWTPSADAKSWTLKLRKGVKFHDGSTFGADDVVATYLPRRQRLEAEHAGLAPFALKQQLDAAAMQLERLRSRPALNPPATAAMAAS